MLLLRDIRAISPITLEAMCHRRCGRTGTMGACSTHECSKLVLNSVMEVVGSIPHVPTCDLLRAAHHRLVEVYGGTRSS